MTRTTNARIAGFMFLFYIAVGITALVLSGNATGGEGTAAKLASIAQHASDVRINVVLGIIISVIALVLAVALYGLTRDEDQDLAMLALSCRVGEALLGQIGTVATLGLLWLATARGGSGAADVATTYALGAFLLQAGRWVTLICAAFFAVGSTLFSWLLLRGRMIPIPLAWLGLVGSALLVVGLPLQLAGFLAGPITLLMWIPVAVFELILGPWLLIKGAAMPAAAVSVPS